MPKILVIYNQVLWPAMLSRATLEKQRAQPIID